MQRFKVQRALRATKVNMEIVSLMRFAYARASMQPESDDAIWRAYWAGEGEFEIDLPSADATQREVHKSGALWEWIIDGNLIHESGA